MRGSSIHECMHYQILQIFFLCIPVFRSKVLKAHRYNTYGEVDFSSSSSDYSEEETAKSISPKAGGGGGTSLSPSSRTEASPEQQAINIMRRHEEFLRKEQTVAEKYRKKLSELPRSVSSRRPVEDSLSSCSTPRGGAGEEEEEGEKKGREPQTEKNRKRKLKKRKAKEKRFKLTQVDTSKDHSSPQI